MPTSAGGEEAPQQGPELGLQLQSGHCGPWKGSLLGRSRGWHSCFS